MTCHQETSGKQHSSANNTAQPTTRLSQQRSSGSNTAQPTAQLRPQHSSGHSIAQPTTQPICSPSQSVWQPVLNPSSLAACAIDWQLSFELATVFDNVCARLFVEILGSLCFLYLIMFCNRFRSRGVCCILRMFFCVWWHCFFVWDFEIVS